MTVVGLAAMKTEMGHQKQREVEQATARSLFPGRPGLAV